MSKPLGVKHDNGIMNPDLRSLTLNPEYTVLFLRGLVHGGKQDEARF